MLISKRHCKTRKAPSRYLRRTAVWADGSPFLSVLGVPICRVHSPHGWRPAKLKTTFGLLGGMERGPTDGPRYKPTTGDSVRATAFTALPSPPRGTPEIKGCGHPRGYSTPRADRNAGGPLNPHCRLDRRMGRFSQSNLHRMAKGGVQRYNRSRYAETAVPTGVFRLCRHRR